MMTDTRYLETFVEDGSMKITLEALLPKLLGRRDCYFQVHPFNGSADMLKKLPQRLKALRRSLADNAGILVLIDADQGDCRKRKALLEKMAEDAGFLTRTACGGQGRFRVVNRLAVEELEAWFFGDVEAIRASYEKISPTLGQQATYRDPDAIKGGTWEALFRELENAGYHPGGKRTIAQKIAPFMDPDRNLSRSFQVFREGVRSLVDNLT